MPPFHRLVSQLLSLAGASHRPLQPLLRPLAALFAGAAVFAAATGLIAALLIACDAGTSSGVDNPELTVDFVNPAGIALRVNGDLEVYAQDQNPALNPGPLITLKVTNSGFKVL